MSFPLRLRLLCAAAIAVAVAACDRDRALLELDLATAEARLAELERAERGGSIEGWIADVERRLPDGPRGAFTASIAAAFPGLELDGTLEGIKNGYVSTEPVEVALPLDPADRTDPAKLRALFDRVRNFGRVWQLDSVRREGSLLYVRLHAFIFSGALQKLGVHVEPDEGTWLSKERDQLRARTRRVLEEIDAKTATIDEAAFARYWKAQLKRSLLADLSGRMELIEDDAALLLQIFDEAELIPAEWTIGIRMGRRVCAIQVDDEAEKKRLIAVGGSKPGVAVDAKERELVLKSGRVCLVNVGPRR